jgi:flavorubredoxin
MFEPDAPTTSRPPTQVAPDTWVIHQIQPAFGTPMWVYVNSMVIAGTEPVIVDTGTLCNRTQWLEDVFSIVDPADVRWVFLSHDDSDHTGNLGEVMTRCPNATLVTNWATVERNINWFGFPLERTRWVNDDESFDAGDRTLRAVQPPNFDSPTTRGLFDERTGVHWAVDSFASIMPEPVDTVVDLDPEFWREAMVFGLHHLVSPWLALVDQDRYEMHVARSRLLQPNVITGAHTPVIPAEMIDKAYAQTVDLPKVTPPPAPDHAALLEIVAGAAAEA